MFINNSFGNALMMVCLFLMGYAKASPFTCRPGRTCLPAKDCADFAALMTSGSLSVQRFRQAICGYESTEVKICCNPPGEDPEYNEPPKKPQFRGNCGRIFTRDAMGGWQGASPFVARVGFINVNDGSIQYSCMGTILGKRTVMTTATCALASSDDYKLHSVLLGEFNTLTDPDCSSLFCALSPTSYNISSVVKHPDFNAETYRSNIALLRLEKDIQYTLMIQPICYTDDQQVRVPGKRGMLVGWGQTSRTEEASTNITLIPVIFKDANMCQQFLDQGLEVEVCSKTRFPVCSGFAGSPVTRPFHNVHIVVGMLSYGTSCNDTKAELTTLVDISKYSSWIYENSQ